MNLSMIRSAYTVVGSVPSGMRSQIARVPDASSTHSPVPPTWAAELARDRGEFALHDSRIAGARSLSGRQLEDAVQQAYDTLQRRLRAGPAPHPVRFWNFVPEILKLDEQGLERYMHFNAGRHRAFSKWFGAEQFDHLLPAASGVGWEGDDLVIYALAAREPGVAICNPRQRAPHRYSSRYGPLPPCFARATLVDRGRLLLVGGTASVRGEESVHRDDIAAQLRETFQNLAAVAAQGFAIDSASVALSCFRQLRVYYVRPEDFSFIKSEVASNLAPSVHCEFLRADLCRADLLVEMEGLAMRTSHSSGGPASPSTGTPGEGWGGGAIR